MTIPIEKGILAINGDRTEEFEDTKGWKKQERKFYRHTFNGINVKVSSLRLTTFKVKGTVCVKCGLEASYFAIDQYKKEGPAFNLFGRKNGKEVLFTKDHIYPKSKGGKNCLSNMQTMCERCNQKKGDSVPDNHMLHSLTFK